MGEEFLEEHHFEEEVIHQDEHTTFLSMMPDKLEHFKLILQERLFNTADEKTIVQLVVMAALETEGITVTRPEIIVEAVMANAEMRTEALLYAEELMGHNLQ